MTNRKTVSTGLHFLLGCMYFVTGGLFAAEWTTNAGLSTGLTFTDNVNLASSNEKSDIIATLTPDISIVGKGARANLDIAASVEFNNLNNSSGSSNTQLQANADVELVERILFVDAKSTITQNTIDPLVTSGTDTLNGTSNSTTTTTVQVSPYVKGRLKSFADFEARYTYRDIANSEIQNGGSNSDAFLIELKSGDDFKRVTWGIEGNHKTTESESGNSRDNTSLDFSLGFQFNRKWQLNTTLGREWNDSGSSSSDGNGLTWDIGARWTPNARTELDFGIGERYFGPTKRLSFEHRTKKTIWTASYTHTLTDSHTLLSDQDILGSTDAFDRPVDPLTGLPVTNSQDLAAIGSNAFVDQRFDTSFTWQGRRTTLIVNAGQSTQTRSNPNTETRLMNVGVTATRRLSGQLTADASISLRETESSGALTLSSETISVGAGVRQQLGVDTDLRLNYTYADKSSEQAGQEYGENRFALTLNHDF